MNLKTVKIIGVFNIFLLAFLAHFVNDFCHNMLSFSLFPVNESIWEHMKLLFTPFIINTVIFYFIGKKKENNLLLQLFLVPVTSIVIYLMIYLPIYNMWGENLIISILLLFVVICFEQLFSYFLATYEQGKLSNVIGFIGLFLVFFIFAYLTYFPLENYLFLDTNSNSYGIIYKD